MSAQLTDEQLLSLPFNELAALCADADERAMVAKRLSALATPSFPAQPGSLAHAFATEIERRMIAWVQHCAPLRESEYACAALRAFGEAIATVARARLVSRVADGRTVATKLGDGSVLDLSVCARGTALRAYASVEARFCLLGRTLQEFGDHPEDIAADAVARLIEETNR